MVPPCRIVDLAGFANTVFSCSPINAIDRGSPSRGAHSKDSSMSKTTVESRRNLMAILRGVKPDEAVEIGEALVAGGINLIAVPLNFTDAFETVARLSKALAGRAEIGGGTVTGIDQIADLIDAGGTFAVAPNADAYVIEIARTRRLKTYPGVFTATEAFSAIEAGADALNLYPAFLLGAAGIKALKAVLPATVPLWAIGGVTKADLAGFAAAGCDGFGLGSGLYEAGMPAAEVQAKSEGFSKAYDAAFGN
jgi:2-dehydro-3-deoxyphosphogalactonate aldolase